MALVIWISKSISHSISCYWWWLLSGAAQCCFVGSSVLILCPDAKDRSMQLIWKHNPWLISVGRFFLNTRAPTCPCLSLILSLHGRYLPFPLQISFLRDTLRGYLKILLYIQIYIVICRDQQRTTSCRWSLRCRGKEIWIFGTLMSKMKRKMSLGSRPLPMSRKDKREKAAFFSFLFLFP